MKIVAFAGSNSSQSINRKLVINILSYFTNSEINLLDLNNFEMPLFSVDREKKGYPKEVYLFRAQMENCDCIIISLAEHNHSYTVAFKNILDWCSRINMNIFQHKPMLLMSTSDGKRGGANVMNAAIPFFPRCGATIIETFSLPSFYSNFDIEKGITDPILKADLENKIAIFKMKIGMI